MPQVRRMGVPQPTPETKPFWDAAKRGELWIKRCKDCGQHHYYPRVVCPNCFSRNVEWVKSSGKGSLYTYNINVRTAPGWENNPNYIIALVTLEEGPRIMSNLVNIPFDQDPVKMAQHIQVGMPVEVTFEELSEEISVPRFKPAGS
ncbi:MAG TPA: Zn-ribbon domain-containing OB-fold protein [Dehalococcoidia bacterium]|nr:Zn-ribbon domain-containing OB-fold protein [Dehalococcoidia bacterium]